MRTFLTTMLVILLFVGIAQGVTKVYPEDVIGSQTFSGTSSGISVTIVNGLAGAGDTTVASVAAGEVLRLMRFDFKPDADVTGIINVTVGSTNVYAINNALADNVYGENLIPNFYQGAAGDDLVINTPSAVGIRYNAVYRKD
jgi:hypothetical protein